MLEFSTEALIRAMYMPIDDVIKNFKVEEQRNKDCHETKECYWVTEQAQGNFASILYRIMKPRKHELVLEPTTRYIRKLLQRYAYYIENIHSKPIENDDLVQLIMDYQFRSSAKNIDYKGISLQDDNLPNPLESCHISFNLPNYSCHERDCKQDSNDIVAIKIYPHHNDVGVRKVWEAGAALTEFFIENSHYVQNKNVCELGAGVGLTGIAIAGLCGTKSVHMTDYTQSTLENLEYNYKLNYDWIIASRKNFSEQNKKCFEEASLYSDGENDNQIITIGYLEWDDFTKNDNHNHAFADDKVSLSTKYMDYEGNDDIIFQHSNNDSFSVASNADVIIAADVVYDRSVIPQLVQVVRTLLTSSSFQDNSNGKKLGIFATTFRNANTFALFENELRKYDDDIQCEYIDGDIIDNLPCIFPCYCEQPRSHVRICMISVKQRNF